MIWFRFYYFIKIMVLYHIVSSYLFAGNPLCFIRSSKTCFFLWGKITLYWVNVTRPYGTRVVHFNNQFCHDFLNKTRVSNMTLVTHKSGTLTDDSVWLTIHIGVVCEVDFFFVGADVICVCIITHLHGYLQLGPSLAIHFTCTSYSCAANLDCM